LALKFLGGDTGDGGSPRLYQEGDDFLVQGYIVTETELLAELDIPDGETVVRVPRSLWKYLPPGQHESQGAKESADDAGDRPEGHQSPQP
jgi:hypothetical protein